MSYVRFGEDGSEVYVFTAKEGIECCGCSLQQRKWVEEPDTLLGGHLRSVGEVVEHVFRDNAGMIRHLERHRAAGHSVPEHVFDALRDPTDEAENMGIWSVPDGMKEPQ